MTQDDRPEEAKRLEEARFKRGFATARNAAKYFGWNYTTYVQHENGTRGFTRASDKYAKAFRVSRGWLLTGEGEGPDGSARGHGGAFAFDMVPVRDIDSFAQDRVASEVVEKSWPFDPDYLTVELHVDPGEVTLVQVRGDSMEPTLTSGDRVMVNMDDKRVSQPGIFALRDGEGIVFKRVERIIGSAPAKLILSSDNKHHSNHQVLADDIQIIGRVVWAAKRL